MGQIRLHTENQHPGLSGSAVELCVGGWGMVGWVPPNYVITPTLYWFEVGLGQSGLAKVSGYTIAILILSMQSVFVLLCLPHKVDKNCIS